VQFSPFYLKFCQYPYSHLQYSISILIFNFKIKGLENMKRRIYLIAALALVNLGLMKYHEMKGDKRGDIWVMAGNGQHGVDSLLPATSVTK
jgi:hypothetical protein